MDNKERLSDRIVDWGSKVCEERRRGVPEWITDTLKFVAGAGAWVVVLGAEKLDDEVRSRVGGKRPPGTKS